MDAEEAIHEHYVDVAELANGLGIHWSSARRLVLTGKIPSRRIHGKRLIERAVYEQWKANYSPRPGPKAYPGSF